MASTAQQIDDTKGRNPNYVSFIFHQFNKFLLLKLPNFTTNFVRLVSKYASAYIYIQVSPIEIVCILNIFAVNYIFLTKEE